MQILNTANDTIVYVLFAAFSDKLNDVLCQDIAGGLNQINGSAAVNDMHKERMTALHVRALELHNERQRIQALETSGFVRYLAINAFGRRNKRQITMFLGALACVGLYVISPTSVGTIIRAVALQLAMVLL